jgi:hypothetical protein
VRTGVHTSSPVRRLTHSSPALTGRSRSTRARRPATRPKLRPTTSRLHWNRLRHRCRSTNHCSTTWANLIPPATRRQVSRQRAMTARPRPVRRYRPAPSVTAPHATVVPEAATEAEAPSGAGREAARRDPLQYQTRATPMPASTTPPGRTGVDPSRTRPTASRRSRAGSPPPSDDRATRALPRVDPSPAARSTIFT